MKLATTWPWTLALALAALFSMVGGARGGDEPAEDAASLLRKARVAETVENDVPKALDLYRRAVDASGSPDAAKDAALRLAELLELRGKKTEAFAVLDTITGKFTPRLDDAQKKAVHDAIARLLPAGSRARTPLGEIYVLPAPGTSLAGGTSPLDAKILGLLARLDDVSGTDRLQVENQVRQAFDVVGKDALPTLERAMNSERLDKAQFAAKEYARIGGKDAVPGLERTIREGDGFARGAALYALRYSLPKGDETSPAVVAAMDRLIPAAKDADLHRALLGVLSQHLSDDDLLRRHEAGGPDAGFFLLVAVQRNVPAAIEKALSLAESAEPLPKDLIETLPALAGGQIVGWNNERPTVQPANPSLESAKRVRILRLVTSQPATTTSVSAAAAIATAVVGTASEAEGLEAATSAWTFALSAKYASDRAYACELLAKGGVAPPATLFEAPEAAATFWSTFPELVRRLRNFQWGMAPLLRPARQGNVAFWNSFTEALGVLTSDEQNTLMSVLQSVLGNTTPPKEIGARWIDLLASARFSPSGGIPAFLAYGAAGSGDPRFLDLVRKHLLGRDRSQGLTNLQSTLLTGLPWYRGSDRLEVVLALLEDEAVVSRSPDPLKNALSGEVSNPAFWPAIQRALARGAAYGPIISAASERLNQQLPPAEFDRGWLDVFDANPKVLTHNWSAPASAAARSGDPRFLRHLREHTLAGKGDNAGTTLLQALPLYRGPGRLEYVLEAFGEAGLSSNWARAILLGVLQEEYAAPAARDRLVALASDASNAASQFAIQRLVQVRDTATLLRLMEARRRAKEPGANEHRLALVQAAHTLHLRESIPFLLREFQEGLSDAAAKAMDAIREYHERLERYSAWTKGEDGGRKDLAALLKDADPEIRRAAILSIAALGEKDALPALVTMAKEDADPSVRKAALDAVERLSKNQAPTPPAPSAMDD